MRRVSRLRETVAASRAALVPTILALGGCSSLSQQPFSLPAESIATALGPIPETGLAPRLFCASSIEEAAVAGLAPYCGSHFSLGVAADEPRCAREAMRHLLSSRPDAILVVTGRPEVAGVSNYYFNNPFAPGWVSVASAEHRTEFVGYAMRAARASLPFTYNTVSGVVTTISDRPACPGLLEGDVLTLIDGAPALPPKAWPEWDLYPRMLQHSPGTEIPISWVRGGVGKMSGKARLGTPTWSHLHVANSVDLAGMPEINEVEQDGRRVWQLDPHVSLMEQDYWAKFGRAMPPKVRR